MRYTSTVLLVLFCLAAGGCGLTPKSKRLEHDIIQIDQEIDTLKLKLPSVAAEDRVSIEREIERLMAKRAGLVEEKKEVDEKANVIGDAIQLLVWILGLYLGIPGIADAAGAVGKKVVLG